MTEYLLQVELATKRLIKNYEITEEYPARTIVPEGREQVIITDKSKFDNAVAAQKDHKINTYAQSIVDFTEKEPKLNSPALVINTKTGESSITKRVVTAGCIYKWNNTEWEQIMPKFGDKRFVYCLNAIYKYNGSDWVEDLGPLPKLEYSTDGITIDWSIV